MAKYKLTLARTILFSLLLGAGIFYLLKEGIDTMTTTEILLSFGLLFILFIILLSGAGSLFNKKD